MLNLSPKRVTFLGINQKGDDRKKPKRTLVVGVFDPSKPAASRGSLKLYDVPPQLQDFTLKHSYSGFGKIIGVDYRAR
jgi:hypothetical protein